MGIMIKDQEIIDALTVLAKQKRTTKARALHDALAAECARLDGTADQKLFPRDRVSYPTFTL